MGLSEGVNTIKKPTGGNTNTMFSLAASITSVLWPWSECEASPNSVYRCESELPVQLPAVTGGRPGA